MNPSLYGFLALFKINKTFFKPHLLKCISVYLLTLSLLNLLFPQLSAFIINNTRCLFYFIGPFFCLLKIYFLSDCSSLPTHRVAATLPVKWSTCPPHIVVEVWLPPQLCLYGCLTWVSQPLQVLLPPPDLGEQFRPPKTGAVLTTKPRGALSKVSVIAGQ